MPVTVEEKFGRSLSDRSAERVYLVRGVDDEGTARAAVLDEAPLTLNGLKRDDAEVEELEGAGHFIGIARYVKPSYQKPAAGEYSFSFETRGGTQHTKVSKQTVAGYTSGGAVSPLFGNLIGVHDDQVDGVDIVAPVFNFNVTKYFDSIDAAYVDTLYRLTGTVNGATWNAPVAPGSPGVTLPFEKGEVLFLGAAGSKRGDDPWEIAFAFAGSPNVTSVSVGDITIAAKEGWHYLWCRYQAAEDTTNKLLVMKPVMAIVERVYDYGAFGGLGL